MFDIAEARAALLTQRRDLQAECDANSKLQRRFDQISSQLRSSTTSTSHNSNNNNNNNNPTSNHNNNMKNNNSAGNKIKGNHANQGNQMNDDDEPSIFGFAATPEELNAAAAAARSSTSSNINSSSTTNSNTNTSPFELSSETLEGLRYASQDLSDFDVSDYHVTGRSNDNNNEGDDEL